jgi:hypothetical protein
VGSAGGRAAIAIRLCVTDGVGEPLAEHYRGELLRQLRAQVAH